MIPYFKLYISKFLLLSIFVIIFGSCLKDERKILVGTYIEDRNFLNEAIISDNNRVVILESDSIEGISLWLGCMFARINEPKQEIIRNEFNDVFLIVKGDTTRIERLNKTDFVLIDKRDLKFNYSLALDANFNIEYDELISEIERSTLSYEIDGEKIIARFRYTGEAILIKEIGYEELLDIGRWRLQKVDDFYFLSIQGFDELYSFQLLSISSKIIRASFFRDGEIEELEFKIKNDNYSIPVVGKWRYENTRNYLEHNPLLRSRASYSETWLLESDEFEITHVVPDKDSIRQYGSYLDFQSGVIVTEYNTIFSFDVLDEGKLELFPININGVVNRNFSKIFVRKEKIRPT